MTKILVEHNPSEERLQKLGVSHWPLWSKEESEFPWTYEDEEICYFLEGDVTVTLQGGEAVDMGKGDLVTFPAGLSCLWKIKRAVRKHYSLG